MNKKLSALLALIFSLCLIVGCGKEKGDVPASTLGSEPTEASMTSPTTAPTTPPAPTETQRETGTDVVVGSEDASNAVGGAIEITGVNKKRIPYTGNRSSVVYITSASELPSYSELAQYDDAYFEEYALVLVTETVSSGSMDVDILSVNINSTTATVTLYHEAPSDAASTADMTTWLLWAEVEGGLDCQWVVENPALEPDTAAY